MIFAFLLAGCISTSSSPNPRFYMLSSMDKDAVSQKFNMPADVIIEIGPVNIPEYLDRPQIVTQDKNKMLIFAQFDRWGESLDSALVRLLAENLTLMLPGASLQMFPCNFVIPLKYRVIIDVIQMDSELDKDLFLVAQWSIIDLKNKKMALTKRFEFRQPIDPHTYAGLAKTLSIACGSLSNEMAQAVSEITAKK